MTKQSCLVCSVTEKASTGSEKPHFKQKVGILKRPSLTCVTPSTNMLEVFCIIPHYSSLEFSFFVPLTLSPHSSSPPKKLPHITILSILLNIINSAVRGCFPCHKKRKRRKVWQIDCLADKNADSRCFNLLMLIL